LKPPLGKNWKKIERAYNLSNHFEWVSNLVPVQKTIDQIRLFVDFRALNRASVKYHFSLPNMEMILQQVAGSQMMSLLDGFFGYNQIKVKIVDRYKTKFTTH
jgi:hypothetical protein